MILFILLLILAASPVAAALDLGLVFNPFRDVNVGQFYLQFYRFIDPLIFLILFLSIAQMVFTKTFKDNKKEAKMISIAVALALTFSMALVQNGTDFNLGKLQPLAMIVFLMIIAMLFYNMFSKMFEGNEDQKGLSVAITFLIIFGLMTVPFNALYKWMETNAPLLSAVLNLFAAVCFIYLIIKMFTNMFSGKDKDKGEGSDKDKGGGKGDGNGNGDGEKPPEEDPNKDNRDVNPPKDNTLTPKIIGFRNSMSPFYEKSKDFITKLQQVGYTNAAIRRNVDMPNGITPQMWSDLAEAQTKIIISANTINKIIKEITSDEGYPDISPNDAANYAAGLKNYTDILSFVLKYYKEFVNRYNTGNIPQ